MLSFPIKSKIQREITFVYKSCYNNNLNVENMETNVGYESICWWQLVGLLRIRHQNPKIVSNIQVDEAFCDLPKVKQQESSVLFRDQYDKSKTNFLYKYHILI